MIRSISIFAFFALATVLVIVLQPGPRPDFAYEQSEPSLHETSRNEVQVLPEPKVTAVLTAPDETIAKLKAAAQPAREPAANTGSTGSLQRLQVALDASLAKDVVASDAQVTAVAAPMEVQVPVQTQTGAQAIAPELRDMSWQTLNTLNGLGHVTKAPGQEGSLLNSIIRRSMGHVDGTQVVRSNTTASIKPTVATAPIKAVISTRSPSVAQQNYIVSSGDTLALIAIKLYGSALATDRLMSENPTLRQNPNALRIGQVLKYSMQ